MGNRGDGPHTDSRTVAHHAAAQQQHMGRRGASLALACPLGRATRERKAAHAEVVLAWFRVFWARVKINDGCIEAQPASNDVFSLSV